MISCKTAGPALTVCLIDSERGELQCGKPDGSGFTLPLNGANNYVCMSPDDFQTLVTFIKEKCAK